MKNRLRFASVLVLSLVSYLAIPSIASAGSEPGSDAEADTKALCNVCRVHDGETEFEEVVATFDYQGTTYGFCSTDCRDTFEEAPASYVPPVFPRRAPSFAAHDLEGSRLTSEVFDGRIVLLDFWATWCPPCIEDLPRLSDLHQRYADRGVSVVSLSTDEGDDAPRKVRRMVKRRKATHPVYLDTTDTPAWAAYQVRVVPTQFLIDANGDIVAQWSGQIDLAVVEAAISELLHSDAESGSGD